MKKNILIVSIFVDLPRGLKSHQSAEALQMAIIQRLKAIRIVAKGVAVTAAKFVWIRLSSTKEKDWTLKKLANFKFTLDGVVITPEVVRYGECKAVAKDIAYQISRSNTTTEDLLIALASHIFENDKTLPGFAGLRTSVCGAGGFFVNYTFHCASVKPRPQSGDTESTCYPPIPTSISN